MSGKYTWVENDMENVSLTAVLEEQRHGKCTFTGI